MSKKEKEVRKVPVNMRALLQRINRALAKEYGCVHGLDWPHVVQNETCLPARQLRTARGWRARFDLGEYFVVDIATNTVVEKQVDPEDMGRELEALQPFEEVVTNEEEVKRKK